MALAAGASAAQVAGTGAILSIGGPTGAGGSEVFVTIGEVKDAKLSGRKTSTTMSTNFASLGIQQKVATITDLGTATFTANRVGNDAGQLAINAAQLTRVPYDFKFQIPPNTVNGQTTGDLITFSGIITEAGSFDVSLDKVSEYTFTVDLNSYNSVLGS
ncbi:hypothetical protein [Granulicella tundricola]|uniref:Uncharacterized protein n=1 Tax=Granulicella tundricola (strain ATCC BAA-1859 / DSM 23138 / MP5ACTX9) TaxID=1198114 RepID=E8X0R1_GRATM|nr:hypothetical protein [Granulicella tundricola]ADW69012.1 hypothetical protein AciX9_1966 [Granulicella tundricola MP5ACTX9]